MLGYQPIHGLQILYLRPQNINDLLALRLRHEQTYITNISFSTTDISPDKMKAHLNGQF